MIFTARGTPLYLVQICRKNANNNGFLKGSGCFLKAGIFTALHSKVSRFARKEEIQHGSKTGDISGLKASTRISERERSISVSLITTEVCLAPKPSKSYRTPQGLDYRN